MKKNFISFPSRRAMYTAPKIISRHMRIGLGNHNIAYRSDGEGDDDDPELAAIKQIQTQVENFKTLLADKADAEQFKTLQDTLKQLQDNIKEMQAADISAAIKTINESNEKIWKQVVEMQEEMAKSKEDGEKSTGKKQPFTRKQIEDFIKATFDGEKKTHNPARIEIKAAETMGFGTFNDGSSMTATGGDVFTGRMIDPMFYQRKRKRNLILDNFVLGTATAPKLWYMEKVEEGDSNPVSGDAGGADWILSNEAKPKRSFRVVAREVNAKKAAIFGTVEDKLLRDVASLENWIREDFTDEMREKINDGLLNGNPGVNPEVPLGMKTNAIQYTATTAYDATIQDPNYIDAILAIRALFSDNKETLERVFVSGDVYTAMMHLKDAESRYLNNGLVYINALGQLYIGGVLVVECDSDDVPSTHILAVGADLGFKALAYGPMVFERGLNGEDFRYDRTSYRGYQEFISYIAENRENSVLYDAFENIFDAIVAGSN